MTPKFSVDRSHVKNILAFLFCLVHVPVLFGGTIEYIRTYDLGGLGLKTALLRYDRNSKKMDWIENKTQLGQCPDDMEVCDWIRLRMREVLGKDLDAEIHAGYLFGFSLAGLNKLRSKPLANCDMSLLFKLPSDRLRCIDDGAAHLVASLNTLDLSAFKGPIWNFSLGTGVGSGFTTSEHRPRNLSDFWTFFDRAPWTVLEPSTGLKIWIPCSSHYGFDQIVAQNNGVVDEEVFNKFASRWKGYIEECILDYSTKTSPNKNWGTPVAVVFTGGHIDVYGDRLVKALHTLHVNVPIFTGPKNAGLLGAAWNTVKNPQGPTPLSKMVASSNIDNVKSLIAQGADVNERDALGKSPLSVAIENGNLRLVKLLIQNGAEINVCDFSWQTPLCLAVRSNKLAIVSFLLDQGADVTICDCWRQTPLFFAGKNKRIKSLLKKHGAKLAINTI